jgi:hypothetical protein
MAIMARAIGVPARVAVGLLRPDQQPDGSWVYSSHDLHSWPELYFEGAGWIRFEPTPPVQSDSAPAYTQAAIPAPVENGVTGQVQNDPIRPLPSAADAKHGAPDPATKVADKAASRWLLLAPAGLLLAALGAAPRLLRGMARRRRLTDDGTPEDRIEGAWAELRATAVDLGLGWDDGATLRQRARALARSLAGERDALRALEVVVLGVERSRFSRLGVDEPVAVSVVAAVGEVCASLMATVDVRARRRATWLPASLWRGRRRPLTSPRGPGAGSGRSGDAAPRDETELVSV